MDYSNSPNSYKAYLRNQGQQEIQSLANQITPDTSISSKLLPIADMQNTPIASQGAQQQGSILGAPTSVTQAYGNENPGVEVFSHGFNSGTDFAANPGTALALPGGSQFRVLQAFAGDNTPGHIGDNTNSGYGNSVLVQDMNTGAKLRFSHLSQLNAQPGQVLAGGSVFGQTGQTGNVTGPHLDLEYYDPQGHLGDVLKSQYARYLGGN